MYVSKWVLAEMFDISNDTLIVHIKQTVLLNKASILFIYYTNVKAPGWLTFEYSETIYLDKIRLSKYLHLIICKSQSFPTRLRGCLFIAVWHLNIVFTFYISIDNRRGKYCLIDSTCLKFTYHLQRSCKIFLET